MITYSTRLRSVDNPRGSSQVRPNDIIALYLALALTIKFVESQP